MSEMEIPDIPISARDPQTNWGGDVEGSYTDNETYLRESLNRIALSEKVETEDVVRYLRELARSGIEFNQKGTEEYIGPEEIENGAKAFEDIENGKEPDGDGILYYAAMTNYIYLQLEEKYTPEECEGFNIYSSEMDKKLKDLP